MPDSPAAAPTLKTLAVAPGKLAPGFSSGRWMYVVYLPHAANTITLHVEADAPGSAVSVNGTPATSAGTVGPLALPVGRTVLQVEVTGPDGKAGSRYTVRAIRACPTPTWTRVAEAAPWSPRDSAGEAVFRDRMWIFGGYTPELVNDVWSSADGVRWTAGRPVPDPGGINIPVALAFDGRMWVSTSSGQLFASRDGQAWSLVTDQAPWQGRYAPGAIVFHDRMWVLGGAMGGGACNDVWSSVDGVHWTQESAHAPWSPRQLFGMLAVHAGKLWLLGGGITVYHPFRAYTDVWNTTDGRHWTQVTAAAPWPARIWSSSLVYRDRLWVCGGFRAEPDWINFNDAWYSADGCRWHQLATDTIWSPRHEISAYVFDDKLWVIGGNAWPLMNDAWHLDIRGFAFVTQPPVEDFVGAQYTYQARADFQASGQPVRYRLVTAPDWLRIDPDTGVVRGRLPDAPQEAQVTIEASAAAGETAQQSYTLHVITMA